MRKVVLLLLIVLLSGAAQAAAENLTCWFPPDWKDKEAKAKAITDALSATSGQSIKPRIARNYPEILEAFSGNQPHLAYVGSFTQAIIAARKLGTVMVQNADGKEMYAGILICPKEKDPKEILKQAPQAIAFARGASSGESTAKAATGGKAAVAVGSHAEAVKAVQEGRAQAAVVKDWWWLSNEKNYGSFKSFRIPGFSDQKNPDNVLTASRAVPKALVEKITQAALASSAAFGDKSVVLPFAPGQLAYSLGLMRKGNIDPLTYSW